MATRTAARRSHAHGHRPHPPVPRHPRRISGPVARPVPAAAPVARPAGYRSRGTTGAFERLRALPEHKVVDRLLRGRAWIWLIGIMLGGIVAMQVSLLKLNAGISQSVEAASTLERVNAGLETEVARLSSGERIQTAASEEGMVAPPAGDVGYVTARPDADPRLAAERMQSPSEEARQVMASGGHAPAELLPGAIAPVAPVVPAATGTEPAPVATPDPVATPVATAPPVPTATPEPPPPAAAGTGATTAPAG